MIGNIVTDIDTHNYFFRVINVEPDRITLDHLTVDGTRKKAITSMYLEDFHDKYCEPTLRQKFRFRKIQGIITNSELAKWRVQ